MNRYTPKAGLGASSIMLILVTLCLTVFSVLALASARSDQKLSETALAGTAAYYAADAEAQRKLAELDALLQSGQGPEDAPGVTAVETGHLFTVEVDSNRILVVRFTVEDGACRVTGYCVESAGDWEPGEEGSLYQ